MRLSSAVHFVGISGIGMSALARILLQRGYRVSGSSDRATPLTARLIEEGATVAIGHDARNLGAAGTVVVSTAIGERNPEVVAARERDLPVVHRGALLAMLMEGRRGIAIAGTHGKTTTTAMVARVLECAGLDPSVAVGGERVDSGTNAREGGGPWFVAESDESDGSFLALHPEIAVVTNIDNDHVDTAAELQELIGKFERFLAGLPSDGLALVGVDEARAAALAGLSRAARTRTFGFAPSDVRALDVRYVGLGSRSTIVVDGVPLGELRLEVPGAINVLDALPALGIALELGVPFAQAAAALAGFRGVRRRFDVLARSPRMPLVDDYAHHPTAVAATIAAARAAFAGRSSSRFSRTVTRAPRRSGGFRARVARRRSRRAHPGLRRLGSADSGRRRAHDRRTVARGGHAGRLRRGGRRLPGVLMESRRQAPWCCAGRRARSAPTPRGWPRASNAIRCAP